MGEYDAQEVAKFVVNECREARKPVDNLKLQKILYFVWIDYYKKTGKRLFEDSIQAWKYGPVVPKVYTKYRECVAEPILYREKASLSEEDKRILRPFIEEYNKRSVSSLVRETHREGGPWWKYYEEDVPYKTINYKAIEEYADSL